MPAYTCPSIPPTPIHTSIHLSIYPQTSPSILPPTYPSTQPDTVCSTSHQCFSFLAFEESTSRATYSQRPQKERLRHSDPGVYSDVRETPIMKYQMLTPNCFIFLSWKSPTGRWKQQTVLLLTQSTQPNSLQNPKHKKSPSIQAVSTAVPYH